MHTEMKVVVIATMLIGTAPFGWPDAARADSVINLDTFTIWTTRTESRVVDVLAGASAVTREQIEQTQAGSISEVLRSIPGVEVMQNGRDPASAINIRGLQDFGRVNVMIEGARQNFQTSGHSADGVFYLDPALVERVDVTRGPVSVIFGSGAIGGVVNFQLRDPGSFMNPGEAWAGSVTGEYDSNIDGFHLSAIAAAQPNDKIGFLGNLVFRTDSGTRDGDGVKFANSDEELVAGLGRVVFTPNDEHKIDFTYLRQTNEFISGLGTRQRDTEVVDTTAVLKWTFDPRDNDWIDLRLSTYITKTETDQVRLNNGDFRSFDIETTGIDVANTSRFDIGSVMHQVTYGGDFFQDQVTTFDQGNGGGPNAFTPTGERSVFGFFAQDEIQINDWFQVIAALRYDEYSLEAGGIGSSGSRVSPKITAGVTVAPGVEFFATYAEGYRAPAITETLISGIHPGGFAFIFFPNPNLRPEVAHNVEGGVNFSFDEVFTASDVFRAKVTVFHNKVDDFIDGVFDPFNPPPFGSFQYTNIANVNLYGLEMEASYDAGDVFASASLSIIRGENDTTGANLSNIPPDKISGMLGFRRMDERLVFGTIVTHYWGQNRVPTGGFTSEAYTLVDLFASYEHNENISFNTSIHNLFDTQYLPYLANVPSTSAIPGPGISARIGATVRFGG
ncbi:MAG: TonB-dependent hemoglobin/transferrin/lactoferrin family receptor [Rhizobiales bacterium]|nr:TonB-dependent hemoglobin/transferrin/lactoferrin family receptor [Hyphomicrobiales bacterium]